ncbi:MAG: hypothetical protein HYX95_03370 [Chloroflexi bacterium]|nr:hypothetical protein [Chloroflexota bacterium]
MLLEIYVADHCIGSEEAHRLAAEARRVLPTVDVRVRSLDSIQAGKMPILPGTPAYFLDGRLVFLGNPSVMELVREMAPGWRNNTA